MAQLLGSVMTLSCPSFSAALTRADIPPPAATDVTFDQSVDEPEPPDELPLLLHPAASTTVPITAAMATVVFFLFTFPPQTCMTALGQDASIVARGHEGEVSTDNTVAICFMNGIRLEE
ncbi:MAG TPA: hypothetical protein VMC03_01175 [Streptosporangiaceae bacterium]|nr:hypothetical protein [Streptosporangiaceae bacterium]